MKLRIWPQSIEIFRGIAVVTALSATFAAAQAPQFLPTLVTIGGNSHAGFYGDGGLATNAMLSSTIAAGTMDQVGNIYIADTGNNRIRMITPAGIISTFAGGATTATVCAAATDTVGDGCPATQAVLAAPGAVRYHQGSVYITDFTNGRIRAVNLSTGIITTIAGGGTAALNNSTNANSNHATAISIPQPQDIAFDNLGNMYWSQGGGTSRVDVEDLATGLVHLFAGTGGTGGATGTDLGTATQTLTQPEETVMNGPLGVVVDSQNNVYIVETATHVIRKVTVGTVPVMSTYAGIGIGTGAAICANATDSLGDGCPATGATFGTMEHMSIDGAGNIYVADNTSNRIRVIPPSSNPAVGGVVYTLIGNGIATDSPDGTYAAAATIGTPWDAQIMPDGDLLLIDRVSSLVRLLHLPGNFTATTVGATSLAETFNVLTQAGTGTFSLPNATDFVGQSTPTCAPAINLTGTVCSVTGSFQPTLAGYRTNPLIFTDSNGTAVAGVSGTGIAAAATLLPGLTATAAGTGTSGATGDGTAAAGATFTTPGAVAIDGQGNVYVADAAANEVRKFTPGGTITRVAGTGTMGSSGDGAAATSATLASPGGVAVDAAGNVYIADTGNNKIRMVSAATGIITTVAGTGMAGYTGDASTPVNATLNAPMQLAWSPLGFLYVADTGNSAVRSIALGEQLITTIAGSVNPGFGGDGGPGLAAELQNPQGVAVDGKNDLFIADTGNNRIREVSQGIISTIAGQTGAGYLGDGQATSTELDAPTGVAADSAGNVYVADTMNQRIRVISSGQIATVMGTGTAGASGDGGSSAFATVSSPLALALDPAGNVYIADTGNHKIRSIATSTNSLVFATLNPGESSAAQTVTVYDSGNQALSVSSVVVPAGYTEQASSSGVDCTSAPISVASGASCNLNTVFSPPTIGTYNSAITIADNSENVSTATQTINVSGTSAYVFTATLTIPAAGTAGTALAGTLTVNNPQATYTRTVTFTSTDPQAVLPPNHTFTTADNGTLPISVTFKTAGKQCLTVTDTTDPTVTSTACTSVAASAPAKIAVFTGNNQTANVSTAYPQGLVTFVTDAYGNAVSGATVNFTVTPNGAGTGSFAGGSLTYSAPTDFSGYATASTVTSGPTIGTFNVVAALAGTSATASFKLTIVVLGSFTIVPVSTQVGPVEPGSSTSTGLTIIGSGGFNAPVTLTCTSPTGTTCSVGPSPLPFANGKPISQAAVNFTSEGTLRNAGGFSTPWLALAAFAVGGLLWRRRRSVGAIALAVVALMVLGAASGCGTAYTPTTANGSYIVMITGTAQTATATTSVTFNVQQQ